MSEKKNSIKIVRNTLAMFSVHPPASGHLPVGFVEDFDIDGTGRIELWVESSHGRLLFKFSDKGDLKLSKATKSFTIRKIANLFDKETTRFPIFKGSKEGTFEVRIKEARSTGKWIAYKDLPNNYSIERKTTAKGVLLENEHLKKELARKEKALLALTRQVEKLLNNLKKLDLTFADYEDQDL